MTRNLFILMPSKIRWGYRQTRRYPLILTYSILLNFYLLQGLIESTRDSLLEIEVIIYA